MATTVGSMEGINLGIIVTPFLDMAFQLLAFFIMTYKPQALERHIDGKLLPPLNPAISEPKLEKKDKDVVPDDKDPLLEIKEQYMVIIKAVPRGAVRGELREGEPTQIQLKRPEAANEPDTLADVDPNAVTWEINKDGEKERKIKGWETGMDILKRELEKVVKGPAGAQGTINIKAEPALHNEFVVRVYDVCRLSGFKAVGFAPP
jgi:biopolymer transport protein ExbD